MAKEQLFFQEELLVYPRLFGLIGYPLAHSFSKNYFSQKFAREGTQGQHYYELFPLERIEELPQLQEWYPQLKGLNVTIPYKELVLDYLTALSSDAESIGAVNTIKIEGQSWTGYNTDVYGFSLSLKKLIGQRKKPNRALVLGTGGASKAVVWVLQQEGIDPQLVSRRPRAGVMTYEDLSQEDLEDYPLIINTTPLGMSSLSDSYPDLAYEELTPDHMLYDLVYNPPQTLFLQKGMVAGAATMNGQAMLEAQAEKAWEIWHTPSGG